MEVDDSYHIDNLIGDGNMSTIFLSDTHCGDEKSKHVELLDYLRVHQKEIDKIVICGDFLDLWVANIGTALSIASPMLKFFKDNYLGKIYYLLGNHDQDLLFLKNIFPFIHTSLTFPAGGKRGICLHGQVLDPDPYIKTRFSHYMAWFINKFDKWAKVDTRKSLVSLSERIKNDPYEKLLKEYEQNIVDVFDGKFDIVLTGHTHQPKIEKIGNLVYINTGDLMQHCTFVKGNSDGFFLIDYSSGKEDIMSQYLFKEN